MVITTSVLQTPCLLAEDARKAATTDKLTAIGAAPVFCFAAKWGTVLPQNSPPFCGKSPCILRHNATRFAAKRIAFCGKMQHDLTQSNDKKITWDDFCIVPSYFFIITKLLFYRYQQFGYYEFTYICAQISVVMETLESE